MTIVLEFLAMELSKVYLCDIVMIPLLLLFVTSLVLGRAIGVLWSSEGDFFILSFYEYADGLTRKLFFDNDFFISYAYGEWRCGKLY